MTVDIDQKLQILSYGLTLFNMLQNYMKQPNRRTDAETAAEKNCQLMSSVFLFFWFNWQPRKCKSCRANSSQKAYHSFFHDIEGNCPMQDSIQQQQQQQQ
jgi:hypothetical protein